MTPGAIRARKRRNEERDSARYNQTLKEYITYKYSDIIEEFDPFYRQLQEKYPRKRFYSGTKEFRRWRREMIAESFKEVGVEVTVYDIQGQEQQQQQQHSDDEQQQHSDDGDDEQEQNGDEANIELENAGVQLPAVDEGVNIVNELDQMVVELENAGVQLSAPDEGIDLDIYEELKADIEDFNYRIEVELNQY